MILPTDFHTRFDLARCVINGFASITTIERQRGKNQLVLVTIETGNREQARHFFIFDLGKTGCAARLITRAGNNRKNRLTVELNIINREDRIVMHTRWRNIVFARHILIGQHVDHTGSSAHGRQVRSNDLGMGDRREADADMQRAFRFRNIVDIDRFACDMLVG